MMAWIAVLCVLSPAARASVAQVSPYRAPRRRMANQPERELATLNTGRLGIWKAMQQRRGRWLSGAVFAKPPGWALWGAMRFHTAGDAERKKDNQANWMKLDPEVKCYLPGVAGHVSAVPFSNCPVQNNVLISYEYAGAGSRHQYGRAQQAPAIADGWSNGTGKRDSGG